MNHWTQLTLTRRVAVLAEQTDGWAERRRYLGLEVLARCWLTAVDDNGDEVTTELGSTLELSA